MSTVKFFTDADAAANSDEKVWTWGGFGHFSAEAGTWNSATVKLQFKAPRGTWTDVPGVVLSATGSIRFEAGKNAALRAVITGTPTDLTAIAIPVVQ